MDINKKLSLFETKKNRSIIENEFMRKMELDASWDDEKEYIWALIFYQQYNYKFRYIRKYLYVKDENLLLAKILINYFAHRYGIRYEDSLEVLSDFAEKMVYLL
jgi:hypothetical protein